MSGDTIEKRRIDISKPSLGREEYEALWGPIESGWLTQGPNVAEFERAFAKRHGVDHALATTSCTTAIHLVLAALGVGPGDEVIVPAFTWVSTANAVVYCGAKPVLADVDPETNNIDPADIARKLSDRTKAVIVVHLFGLVADMKAIRAVLPDHVAIVEDAACAAGAASAEGPAGSLGIAGCFSFHPRKVITTGEGGMVTTHDAALAEKMTVLRNHGASVPEEVRHSGPKPYLLPAFGEVGFNYRMSDLQGAVGVKQLEKLDGFIEERARWAEWYRDKLQALAWIKPPMVPTEGRHGWQAFVCTVLPDAAPMPRNDIMEKLQEAGISTRPGTHAVHTLDVYRDMFGFSAEDFPGAHACERNTLALPLHNKMTADDYAYVIQRLTEI